VVGPPNAHRRLGQRFLRWLALRGSPPGSLDRPVMRLLRALLAQCRIQLSRWCGLAEQRYRSQIGLHLSEGGEATQPPPVAMNAASHLFVPMPSGLHRRLPCDHTERPRNCGPRAVVALTLGHDRRTNEALTGYCSKINSDTAPITSGNASAPIRPSLHRDLWRTAKFGDGAEPDARFTAQCLA
jgi:hypothetical protein